MRINVLVPVYNVAMYLGALFQTLQEQRFTKWTCIAVDDGSMDRSGEVLDETVRTDVRFMTIHQRNGGVSRARNRAIARATGDYVCFVDGDDCLADAWLNEFARIAQKTHADLVQLCKTNWSDGDSVPKPFSPINHSPVLFDEPDFNRRYRALFHFYLDEAWPFLYCIRRTLLDERYAFPEDVPINEDTVFILRLLPRLQTVAHGDYAGYFYRLRKGSALRSRRKGRALINILDAMKTLWEDIETLPLSPDIRQELRGHLSTFCWGSFLDWVRDALHADVNERRAVRKAMLSLTLAPFWRFGPVCKKYLFLNFPSFVLFRRFGLLWPQVLFAKGIALTRPLRHNRMRSLP